MDNSSKQVIRNVLSSEINRLQHVCNMHKTEASYFYEKADKSQELGDVAFRLLNYNKNEMKKCKSKLKKLRLAIKEIKSTN